MKGLTKTSATQGVPVFNGKVVTVSGGFKLDTSVLPADAYVEPGMPLGFDESTRVAKVVKMAKVYENATNTDTDIKVYKGHLFKDGDYVAVAVGAKAYAVTIDTSNDDYDVFTVGTTLGAALTADTDVLFQSSATGASAAAYAVTARGLNYLPVKVETGADVSAVIGCDQVYERRITGGITSSVKALIPKAFFSQSY